MVTAAIWPVLDYSRVPYRLYHDAELYALEQERIFRRPVWSFLGLDAEIPNPGDFRTTYLGETPIILNRDEKGAIQALSIVAPIAAPRSGASSPATPPITSASTINGVTGSTAA
jgi:hypothetical protein